VADKVIGFTLKVNGIDQTINSIDQLDESIAQLEETLKSAEFGSKQFKEIQADLIKAKSAKEDLDKALEGRGAEKRLQGLVGMAESLGGAFAIASQASALFGKENEAVAKAEAKAQQALAVVMGVRAIKEGLLNSALERKIILEKASAAGTAILNGINKALNITLSANPIGLIVTALGLLVVGIMAAIGPIKKFIAQFDFLGKAVNATLDTLRNVASFLTGGLIDDAATAKTRDNSEKIIAALDDMGSAANKQMAADKRRLALMEAQGASAEKLLAQKKKINAEEVASRQKAIAALMKLQAMDGELDDEKKKKLVELQEQVKDLNNQMLIDQASYNKEKAAKEKEAADKAKEKAKEAADKYKEHQKEMIDAEREAQKKILELKQKAEIDSIKDEELKAQRSLQIQQENAQKELQIEIDKYANKKKLTLEEQKYLNALRAEQKALTESQAIETQNLLDDQAKVRKDKEDAFQKELKDLKNQAFLGTLQDERDHARAELDLQLQTQIEEINQSELSEKQKGEKIAIVREINQQQKQEQEAGFKQKDMEDQLAFNQWQIGQESTTYEEKLALNKANEELITQMHFENEEQRTMALAENAKARKEIEDAATAAKAANLDAIRNLIGNAAALFGEETAAGKALAVAGATIDTYKAATAAYASLAGIPIIGPALGAVAAGVAVAAGIANVKKILSVQVPNSGGGAGGGSSAAPAPTASKFASGGYVSGPGTGQSDSIPALLSNGESVINANSTKMFGGLLNQINQAGGGAPIAHPEINNGGGTPIIKTYVVASEMTNQQEADKRIKDIAKI